MRILFVLENYYPNVGGVETLFKGLIEKLAKEGHQIQLVTTQLTKSSPKIEQLPNITIYRYPFLNRYFFTLLAFIPVLKHSQQVDLIHTTSYNAAIPAAIAALLRGKKSIITFHEVWGKLWFKLPLMNPVSKWMHYLFEKAITKIPFTKFIAVSKFTERNLMKSNVAAKRIEVIYNGLPYQKFNKYQSVKKVKHKHFVMAFYGRLGISKGLDILLQAAPILKQQLPNSYLKMIIPRHPKPIFKKIMNIIEKNDLRDYIELFHYLKEEDLFYQLKTAHCVVIPSRSEGFCFAAAECVALGVPIVTSGKGALKEVVSGKFIEMEAYSVQHLVEALIKAKNNEWQEKPVKQFLIEDSHQQYLNLYQQLMGTKK